MRWKAFQLILTALLACRINTSPAAENDMPAPLLSFLEKSMNLTQSEVHSVIGARAIAKVLNTKTNDEVAIVGIVRIYVPMKFFIEKFRNIVEFESGSGVQAIGLFHTPPIFSDVATLSVDEEDLKTIPHCKPGDCDLKMSDSAMQELQKQIPWGTPQAVNQAQSVIRQTFVDYVAKYQAMGDEALTVYNDKEKAQSVRVGLHDLLENSSDFIEYDPELAKYLQKYPLEKPADTEEIFYWQKAQFGLKPVVRASHVVIHRQQRDHHVTYGIASKMLFASHYFRAALELKSAVPDSPQAGAKSFYLVCMNRSFVDGLTGFKGPLIRGQIKGKSRDSLEGYLTSIKEKLESAASTSR